MGLPFFADHCVPNAVIQSLRSASHTVFCLREHMPTDSADTVVISKSCDMDAILLTLNGDFADIVAYPPAQYQGIIALQLRNHPETIPQAMEGLQTYLSSHPDRNHYRGKLLLVEVHRIRTRK